MKYYIYMTTNLINGKKYIGKHHGYIDDDYLGSGTLLKRAFQKYGKENFKKDILYISKNDQENNEKEKQFIATYDAVHREDFYNIHQGGKGGNTTAGWTEKQRLQHKRYLSKMFSGKKNPRYGIKLSEEIKEKIRLNRDTSYMQTEQYRKHMSQVTSGEKNGMYGKHHTEQSKKKMSINSIGKTAGEKNGMFGKRGENAINGKKVAMYDENMILIKIFNSKTAVLDFLHIKGHSGLDKAIKEKSTYKGYYWSKYQ